MIEDELSFVTPTKPSGLRAMSDEDLMAIYRKLAFANMHAFSAMLEKEMSARLTTALKDYAATATRSGRRIEVLTGVLVFLTIVLVVLTIALLLHGG